MTQPTRIPTEVTHADLMDALEPLLTLLGVTTDDVYYPIVIHADRSDFAAISMTVAYEGLVNAPDDGQLAGHHAAYGATVNVRVR